MSKLLTRKIKTKLKGEGQLGVAEVDPHELDVRKTRHGKYQALGAPTGLTWKQHVSKKQDRHSPSSQFISSSTEAMDSDEAQRVTTKIVQKLVKKQENEEKTDQPLAIEDEQETIPTQTQLELKLLKEKEKPKEVPGIEEDEVDLNDSEVTFASATSKMSPRTRAALNEELDDTIRYEEENPGKRLPIEEPEEYEEDTLKEEGTAIENLTKIKPIPRMVYVSSEETNKDDPIPKEGKIPTGKGNKVDKSEKSGDDKEPTGDKKVGKDVTTKPIMKTPLVDYYLPIMGNPKLTDFPVIREELAPSEEAMGRIIEVPVWETLFKTRYFGVDVKYGLVYPIKNKTWGPMVDKCNLYPLNQYEFKDSTTPVAGVSSPKEVNTLESKTDIPVAESTRKSKFQRVTIKNIGASFSDLENGNISESTITSSSANTDKIKKEVEAAEIARLELDIQREKMEQEKIKATKKQYKYARERIRLARKGRNEIIQAIQEESVKLQKQKEATLQMRRKKRKSLRDKFIKYLKREEPGYEEYLKYVTPNEVDSDYLASISDLPQDHYIPNPGDELGLAKLMLKQVQLEDNLERGRRLYVAKVKDKPEIIDILNESYAEFKQDMELKLEHVNSVMDVYLTREREKEIRERDALLAKQMQMEEEQKAQEEQRRAQEEQKRLQEQHQRRLEQAKKLQQEEEHKRKIEIDRKKQQMEDKINKTLAEQKEYQEKLQELRAAEEARDSIWREYQEERDKVLLKEQQRDMWLQAHEGDEGSKRKVNKKRRKEKLKEDKTQPLGKDERTIPPKYRDKTREPNGEENLENTKRRPGEPYWNFDKDELAKEIYHKHMKKKDAREGAPSSLNIYCGSCARNHWGPCECVICGIPGHDENECPQLEGERSYLEELQKQEEERMKRKSREPCWLCGKVGHVCQPKREKEKRPGRPRGIFCNYCEGDGHLEQNCSIKRDVEERQKLPEEYTDEQLQKEIDERVKRLRNIGNEINERKRNVTFGGKREPEDNMNAEEVRRRTHQEKSKAGHGEKPPRRTNREEEDRQPPRREDMQPGGGGGDDPDPGDDGDEEPTDESEEDDSDEEETTSDSSSGDTPPSPEEREAMESLESSLMSMWDIYGTRITREEWEDWKRKHLMSLLRGKKIEGPYIARGKMGHRGKRGLRGHKGPPGPPGQPIMVPDRRPDVQQAPARDPNVTLDTSALEQSFKELGKSMEKVWGAQYHMNDIVRQQLDMSNKAHENQIKAMEELKNSNRQRNFDYIFAKIKVYDGKSSTEFGDWTERLETACSISGRNIREAAIALSSGAVTKVIRTIPSKAPWSEVKSELKRCFSENKTKVHAATLFNNFRRQGMNENLRSYIYVYTRAHREATGIPAKEEIDVGRKLDFLTRLRNGQIANKVSQSEDFMKYNRYTLEDCFEKALLLESKFQANEMMNLTRESQIDQEKERKNKEKEQAEEDVSIYDLTDDGMRLNRKFGNCYKCGQPGHYSKQCAQIQGAGTAAGGDGSDDENKEVGKIHHQLQAHTAITSKILNDFLQKATKAEVNRKIYQARLKQQQQLNVPVPPPKPPQAKPKVTKAAPQAQAPPAPLQPTAPPMPPPIVIAPQPQQKPRGRSKGGGGQKAQQQQQYSLATLPQVIAQVTSTAPSTAKWQHLVTDSVNELQHEDDQDSFTPSELANLDTSSETDPPTEDLPPENEPDEQ